MTATSNIYKDLYVSASNGRLFSIAPYAQENYSDTIQCFHLDNNLVYTRDQLINPDEYDVRDCAAKAVGIFISTGYHAHLIGIVFDCKGDYYKALETIAGVDSNLLSGFFVEEDDQVDFDEGSLTYVDGCDLPLDLNQLHVKEYAVYMGDGAYRFAIED